VDVKILKLPIVFRAQERRQHHASADKSDSSSVEERPSPLASMATTLTFSLVFPATRANESLQAQTKKTHCELPPIQHSQLLQAKSMHEKGLVRSEI
jgi:hypothetical protein